MKRCLNNSNFKFRSEQWRAEGEANVATVPGIQDREAFKE